MCFISMQFPQLKYQHSAVHKSPKQMMTFCPIFCPRFCPSPETLDMHKGDHLIPFFHVLPGTVPQRLEVGALFFQFPISVLQTHYLQHFHIQNPSVHTFTSHRLNSVKAWYYLWAHPVFLIGPKKLTVSSEIMRMHLPRHTHTTCHPSSTFKGQSSFMKVVCMDCYHHHNISNSCPLFSSMQPCLSPAESII